MAALAAGGQETNFTSMESEKNFSPSCKSQAKHSIRYKKI
jgi:hypothetical protein